MSIKVYTRDGQQKSSEPLFAPQGVVMKAGLTAAASVASGQVVPFNKAILDPYGYFSTSGYSFTPKIPGYYQITAAIHLVGSADGAYHDAMIWKNGVAQNYGREWASATDAANGLTARTQGIIYLNGTTDYVTIGYGASSARTIHASDAWTTFEANLIASSVGVAPEPWHEIGAAGEPGWQNAWSNSGGSAETAAFRKTLDNVVHFKGTIKPGNMALTAFTLPVGYRPSKQRRLTTHMYSTTRQAAMVFIQADGQVQPYAENVSAPGEFALEFSMPL